MRNIPTSMATQHPDNAAKPFWNSRPFISTAAEIKECYLSFSDLMIDEYNWDWEGKFVDEAVVDRLLHKHYTYFAQKKLGKDKFLTFRIPNPRIETQFRLARAFMVAITSSQLAQSLNFENAPIFEAILPLTETAEEIIDIQEAFVNLVNVDHKLLKMKDSIQHLEIIPLIEQVHNIINSAHLLRKYILLHQQTFGHHPAYIRPYCARSDPALNSGLVPTVLAVKVALSDYLQLEKETEVPLFPLLGTGALPFRGGVNPDSIPQSVNEYSGVKTLTLQSAFRYDYPQNDVKKAVLKLKEELPFHKARKLSKNVIRDIALVVPLFESPYRDTVEKIAPLINHLSKEFPRRRERLQHIGLFGYSRGVGKVRLPRAITFTGVLYSLGVPPELIGTGRGIRAAKKKAIWETVKPHYLYLRDDMLRAGYFLNKENLYQLAKEVNGWYEVIEDIKEIEKELQVELGPEKAVHFEHSTVSSKLLEKIKEKKKVSQYITYGGILRKSLG